jgi:hypothetical protein
MTVVCAGGQVNRIDPKSINVGLVAALCCCTGWRSRLNGLALGNLPGVEQVELDFPHDVGDAGLARFPGGEVAGFL